MPWFKKDDEVPEELKGLSTEQIAEIVRKSRENETKLTEVQQQLTDKDTEFQRVNTEFTSIRDRLQNMERESTRRQHQENENVEIPSVVEDENEAFNRRLQPTNAAAIHAGTLAAQLAAEQEINNQKQGFILRKYRKEIDALMAKEPPQRRIFPEVWLNAFTYVKGLHFDEVTNAMREGKNDFFSESASTNTPAPIDNKNDDKLSDAELSVCRKMGVKPENYLKHKKQMRVDTDSFLHEATR